MTVTIAEASRTVETFYEQTFGRRCAAEVAEDFGEGWLFRFADDAGKVGGLYFFVDRDSGELTTYPTNVGPDAAIERHRAQRATR